MTGFSTETLEYMFGIKFLHTCSVIFLHLIFAKIGSFAKCYSTRQTHEMGFLSSFMC